MPSPPRFRTGRSLAGRVMIYLLSAIGGFILLSGGGSFLVVKELLYKQINDQLNLDLQQASLTIQLSLTDAVNNLQQLANHPLLANALTDSVGRDTYLKPFFLEQTLAKQADGALLLGDFRGRSVLTTSEALENWVVGSPLVKRVIANSQPYAELTSEGWLVIAYPVVFPPTGSTEGVVVYRQDLQALLKQVAERWNLFLKIDCDNKSVSNLSAIEPDLLEVGNFLALPQPLDALPFRVTVAQPKQLTLRPLYQVMQAYFLAALLLLALAAGLAKGLSRKLLKHLNALIYQVDAISNTADLPEQTRSQDWDIEIVRLAQAFDRLLVRLHQSYLGLEDKVAQRTLDLTVAQESASQAALYARSLIEASLDPLVTISASGKITDVNKATENITGVDRQTLIGSDFCQYFTNPDQAQRGYLQVFADGQVLDFPLAIRHISGKLTEVLYNFSLYCNTHGKVEGVFAAARDVTQQKFIENELREAKIAAEAASKAKSDFLANMSHEIRTPINAIIGLTELVQDTQLNSKQHDYLKNVQQASRSLLSIINDILDFSKIEAGKIDIELNPFVVEELLQDIADLFAAQIENKGMELFVEATPQVPHAVTGDVMRIRQVLNNLVNNAVKFTEHGEIHVKIDVAEQQENHYLLSFAVRDTGIGLSKQEMERLFQSFTQADASISRRFGGTGLGLAICRQLVELMGGQIAVSSQQGEGSTFVFTIPVTVNLVSHPQRTLPNLLNQRVLVVDDMETSCLIIKNYLEIWRFDVATTLSAKAALRKIQEADQANRPFDLLLLDWRMPEIDGLQLAGQIAEMAQQGRLRRPPMLIMVTASCRDSLLRQADQGLVKPDAVLTKPVSMSGLYNAIVNVYQPNFTEAVREITQKIPLSDLAKPIHGCYVLLVEDNPLNQLIAREFLQKSGLRLVVAEQGAEAVDWVRREHFDAILMDLQMPVMDGFEATRRIRALEEGKQVPIIAMTAAAMQHDREACLAVGMNDHLSKPLNSKQLIGALLRWIKTEKNNTVDIDAAEPAPEQQIITPPGFDFSNVLPLLSDDVEQLFQVLTMFRNDYADAAEEISRLVAQGELLSAEQQVHQLKGVAGNIGAMQLHQISQVLDEQLKQNFCAPELLGQWRAVFADTLQTLDAMREQRVRPETRVISDRSRRQQLLVRLDVLLAQHDFVSGDLLAELKSLIDPQQREAYNYFVACIKKLDYAGARTLLDRLADLPLGDHRDF